MSNEAILAKLNALVSAVKKVESRLQSDESAVWAAFGAQLAMLLLPPVVAVLLLLVVRGRGVRVRVMAIAVAGLLHLPTTAVLVSAYGLLKAGELGGRCCRRRPPADIEMQVDPASAPSSCSIS